MHEGLNGKTSWNGSTYFERNHRAAGEAHDREKTMLLRTRQKKVGTAPAVNPAGYVGLVERERQFQKTNRERVNLERTQPHVAAALREKEAEAKAVNEFGGGTLEPRFPSTTISRKYKVFYHDGVWDPKLGKNGAWSDNMAENKSDPGEKRRGRTTMARDNCAQSPAPPFLSVLGRRLLHFVQRPVLIRFVSRICFYQRRAVLQSGQSRRVELCFARLERPRSCLGRPLEAERHTFMRLTYNTISYSTLPRVSSWKRAEYTEGREGASTHQKIHLFL